MYQAYFSLIIGANDMQQLGVDTTFEGAMDKILDCRNSLRNWNSAEFVVKRDNEDCLRLVLDESGFREVQPVR